MDNIERVVKRIINSTVCGSVSIPFISIDQLIKIMIKYKYTIFDMELDEESTYFICTFNNDIKRDICYTGNIGKGEFAITMMDERLE